MSFHVTRIDDRISRIEEAGVAPFLRCNIWHVRGRDFDLVIDTGFGVSALKDQILAQTDKPVKAICTHSHFDHVAGLCEFDCRLGHRAEAHAFATGGAEATMFADGWTRVDLVNPKIHPAYSGETHMIQPAPLTGYLDEGDIVDLGDVAYQVLHLPGHSPGSIGLWDVGAKTLFSGDAIYDGPLYDSHPHSDPEIYLKTLQRIVRLEAEVIHGGHYPSFGAERAQAIVAQYRPGANDMNDIETWFQEFIASGGDPFAPLDQI